MAREEVTMAAGTGQGQSGMTREEMVAFFARRLEQHNDLDAAAMAQDYAEDAVIESPTAGVHTGRAAAERALRAVFDAFLDMKVTSDRMIIDGDQVAVVMRIEGTNIGGLMGLPPSGKRFSIDAVFLYELKDRQIVRERRIYDFTGLLVQVGVLKAKPV